MTKPKAVKLGTLVAESSPADTHQPVLYPKMLTAAVGRKTVPVLRNGVPVVFNSADEEREYAGGGVPHSGAPEQHSAPLPEYTYWYECKV